MISIDISRRWWQLKSDKTKSELEFFFHFFMWNDDDVDVWFQALTLNISYGLLVYTRSKYGRCRKNRLRSRFLCESRQQRKHFVCFSLFFLFVVEERKKKKSELIINTDKELFIESRLFFFFNAVRFDVGVILRSIEPTLPSRSSYINEKAKRNVNNHHRRERFSFFFFYRAHRHPFTATFSHRTQQ